MTTAPTDGYVVKDHQPEDLFSEIRCVIAFRPERKRHRQHDPVEVAPEGGAMAALTRATLASLVAEISMARKPRLLLWLAAMGVPAGTDVVGKRVKRSPPTSTERSTPGVN